MKTLICMCFGVALVVGCAVDATETTARVEQAAWICEGPPGDYVIAAAADPTPAYTTRRLQAELMGYPTRGTHVGGGIHVNMPETCPGVEACFAGECLGWSCAWVGSAVDPDDGRVGARCDTRPEFLDALTNSENPLYGNITSGERDELTTLRLGCTPFTDFECYEEI